MKTFHVITRTYARVIGATLAALVICCNYGEQDAYFESPTQDVTIVSHR